MWYRSCTRKELLDILISHSREKIQHAEYSKIAPQTFKTRDLILLAWEKDPEVYSDLPCLAVVHEKEITDFLAAMNSSPQAPSPITSFCRVLTRDEFSEYKESGALDLTTEDLSPFVALAYAESMVYADGQIKQYDLSPAICSRTLSLSWAKAISGKVPRSQLPLLTEAWKDIYLLTGSSEKSQKATATVQSLLPVLDLLTELQLDIGNSSAEKDLCRALLSRSKILQEDAWARLKPHSGELPTIASISEATREQRAIAFQQASKSGFGAFILGFLASQIAPGTLDHMDLAISHPDPQVVFWYAALATLLRPSAIMAANSARGVRLLRIANRLPSLQTAPQSDISYIELKVLARAGLDQLTRKLEHAGEISVELIPLVAGTFRFSSRIPKNPDSIENDRLLRDKKNQERMRDQLLSIAKTLEEIAYSDQPEIDLYANRKRVTRR